MTQDPRRVEPLTAAPPGPAAASIGGTAALREVGGALPAPAGPDQGDAVAAATGESPMPRPPADAVEVEAQLWFG
jgi:hypothetical protein